MRCSPCCYPRPQQQALASAAHLSLWRSTQPVTPEQILTPRRYEDNKPDLQRTTYQRIQENLIKGGLSGRNAKGKRSHTKAVKGIAGDVKLNRAFGDGGKYAAVGILIWEVLSIHYTSESSQNFTLQPSEQRAIKRALRAYWINIYVSPGLLLPPPKAVRDWLRLKMVGLEREEFMVLYLSQQHQLTGYETCSPALSTVPKCIPREVVERALYFNAAAVILPTIILRER